MLMGGVVVLYTTLGGIKAVTWADVQQMMMIMGALILALLIAIWKLPTTFVLDAMKSRRAGRVKRSTRISIPTTVTTCGAV